MSKSLRINATQWRVSFLGERALSISPDGDFRLQDIHQTFRILEEADIEGIEDIIPAYQSIALLFENPVSVLSKAVDAIQQKLQQVEVEEFDIKTIEVPVCYELGLDWEDVEKYTKLPEEQISKTHSSGTYTVAMMGFLPGFLYLSGLDNSLACPRKSNPRTNIPEGSVGIAGAQTGIYSLESPGGWQIIGCTPKHFFDVQGDPPIQIRPGDRVRFTPITEQQFREWED